MHACSGNTEKINFYSVKCCSWCLDFSEKLLLEMCTHKMEMLPHQHKLFLSKTYFLLHCRDKQENTLWHANKGDVLVNTSWICVFTQSHIKGTLIHHSCNLKSLNMLQTMDSVLLQRINHCHKLLKIVIEKVI